MITSSLHRRPAVAALAVAAALVAVACKKNESPKPALAAPAADPWGAASPPSTAGSLVVPFLYEATKDGHSVSLLGTIHAGVDAERQLPPWVLARLDAAPAFAMETDISDPATVQLLVRTDGRTLADELGPEDFQLLKDAVGASLADGLSGMKPFAAMSTLALKELPMTTPMDMVLFNRAKAAGKRLVFLEPVQAQLDAIEPYATAADIRAMLHHQAESRAASQKMLADYAAGDGAALAAAFEDKVLWIAAGRDPARFGEFLDATLGKRNRSWVAPITALAEAGGGFVAVGAGHLVGPDNVPSLLEAQGFTVRRVTGP
ncbi:MAG: TraB/GumN family protein [Kofleriaceae bacterium]